MNQGDFHDHKQKQRNISSEFYTAIKLNDLFE